MMLQKPQVFSVSALNDYVKSILDGNDSLSAVFVNGEISNFKAHYSGHLYMTIKDENSSIKAVMFAGNARRLKFMPENGMKILAFGSVSLYTRDGTYQLYISDMQPDGIGALTLAFEQLKKKLENEGLFDAQKKKKLPAFPERVGVVTSETGAAIRDIIHVIKRRYPAVEIILEPVLVQGDGAAEEIAAAVRKFNELNAVDVLIVGRGGGSIEDLWAFNEEIVARAVYESRIPVISAVGHETDVTICDYAADMRAATPSAAAEIAVPDMAGLANELLLINKRLSALEENIISKEREKLSDLRSALERSDPAKVIKEAQRDVLYLSEKLLSLMNSGIETERRSVSSLAGQLNALSPLAVISRGYGIVKRENSVVTSVSRLSVGDEITVALSDGAVKADIIEINGEKNGK